MSDAMRKDRNDLKAGLFIVVSLALILFVIIGIKGIGRMVEPAQHSSVTFKLTDDVGGLRRGDDVRIGGFKVGVVRDIEVRGVADGQPQILVHFTIPRKYKLHKDARLTVQGTLTGTSWLNFDNLGSPAAGLLASGDALVGRPSAMSTLFASAGEIAPELRDVIRDVRSVTLPKVNDTIDTYKTTGAHATALIKYIRGKIDPILERYYAVADAGKSALTHVGDLFGESKGDFRQSVANIKDATGAVKEKLPGILDKVDGGLTKAQNAIDSVNVALDDIKKVAADSKEVSATARSIIVGNRSKIEGMIASLKTTSDNIKFGTAELRRSPWRLLYKPPPGEVANLNLYDSTRQFAEGANDLNDAAAALRDALQDQNVPADHVQKLMDKLEKTFENFSTIEQELWKQVK
jgi:ABC-type transporter Mla subunit MlaD